MPPAKYKKSKYNKLTAEVYRKIDLGPVQTVTFNNGPSKLFLRPPQDVGIWTSLNGHCLFKELVPVTFPRFPPILPSLSGRRPVLMSPPPPLNTFEMFLALAFLILIKGRSRPFFDMHFVKLVVLGQNLVSAPVPPQRKVTSTDLPERRYPFHNLTRLRSSQRLDPQIRQLGSWAQNHQNDLESVSCLPDGSSGLHMFCGWGRARPTQLTRHDGTMLSKSWQVA